jgi:hypothetical protein
VPKSSKLREKRLTERKEEDQFGTSCKSTETESVDERKGYKIKAVRGQRLDRSK